MDQIGKTGTTPAAANTGATTSSGRTSKPKTPKAQTPSAQDQAVLSGQDTKANVKAAARTGALQGTRRGSKKSLSDGEQDVNDFQQIGSVIGNPEEAAAPSASAPQATASQAAGPGAAGQAQIPPQAAGAAADMADMIIGASALLNQQGVKVTPQQIAQALQNARQNNSQNLAQDAASSLGIDPAMFANAMGQSEKMVQADHQTRELAAILSQKTGKNIAPEAIAQAYAQAAQEMQQGGGNIYQPSSGQNIHQIAAQKLGIDPGDLQEAINEIGRSQSGAAGGGGAQPPGGGVPPSGGGSEPPAGGGGAQPPGGGAQPPGGGGAQPQVGGPGTIVNSDYLQNLQHMMSGLGINIPPQIMQAQQGMMNQLYGYGLMQQGVQTQRAGLEQYMQVLNTVMNMNLDVMQNNTMMLQQIVTARQKIYQMQQQMVQTMFQTTAEINQGWLKVYQSVGGGG